MSLVKSDELFASEIPIWARSNAQLSEFFEEIRATVLFPWDYPLMNWSLSSGVALDIIERSLHRDKNPLRLWI
jgi:hypothetical protein